MEQAPRPIKLYLDIKDHPTLEDIENLVDIVTSKSKLDPDDIYFAAFNLYTVHKLCDVIPYEDQYHIGKIGGFFPIYNRLPYRVDFISTEYDLVDEYYIKRIRNTHPKLKIFTYTLNTKLEIDYFKNLGVDCILSDRVDLFR